MHGSSERVCVELSLGGRVAGPIIGFSLGYMNLLNCVAVYATICREEGLAFRWWQHRVPTMCIHLLDVPGGTCCHRTAFRKLPGILWTHTL